MRQVGDALGTQDVLVDGALSVALRRVEPRTSASSSAMNSGRLEERMPARAPPLPQVPITEHPDVRRMLLASKAYAEGSLALVLYAARLLDQSTAGENDTARAEAARLLDVLIPIVKSWPSQWCLTANDLAIQIHGGAGYTRDHNVEQFYRDNRLNPIHEGTHGIHGLDLLGRKVVLDNARPTSRPPVTW
ncbi:acyl-CoA dehydrogenase family protein [Streptomyces bobili]|uniref:acyl-CoA dehydrogenase family protein n=1 Tax=Streptomyces bobili TaxID=67280 RepID=UPI00364FC079